MGSGASGRDGGPGAGDVTARSPVDHAGSPQLLGPSIASQTVPVYTRLRAYIQDRNTLGVALGAEPGRGLPDAGAS